MFNNQAKRTKRNRKVLAIVLGLSLVLTASACASDGPGGASPQNDDGSAHVRLANYGFLPTSAYLAWAIEGGYFKNHDVEVELLPAMLNATDMLNAVTSGDADLAVTAPNSVAFARNRGQRVKVVATTNLGYPVEVAFTPAIDKRLRAKGLSDTSPIKDRIAALKGMTLGLGAAGSLIDLGFRSVVMSNGLDPDVDLTLQPMPDAASQLAALNAGTVDGIVSNLGSISTFAESAGTGVVWDYMTGDQNLSVFPSNVVAASESYIDSNPDSIQRFLDALHEARAAVVAGLSSEDAAKLKAVVAPDMDREIWDKTLEEHNALWTDPFVTSERGWDAVLALVNIAADAPVNVPASEAIDNTFADAVD